MSPVNVALLVAGALVGGLLLYVLTAWLVRRAAGIGEMLNAAPRSARWSARAFFPLLLLKVVTPLLPLTDVEREAIDHGLLVLLIVATVALVLGASRMVQVFVQRRFRVDVPDNLQARRIQTKVRILRQIVSALLVFLGAAGILMTFESARQIGISLFASAGVAGLVIGVAAQSTLSNLVAGVQVALTEPIRLDDVVIVEGEWGWIEEITMTYVVVRVWDLRRLVVPLRWFTENPFENWTRNTADILGSVFLHLDYRAPLEELRTELQRVVEEDGREFWDGEVCRLHVVDADDRTVRVRALVSAGSSPDAWELRCLVRERLVTWLQENHPSALPRIRARVEETT